MDLMVFVRGIPKPQPRQRAFYQKGVGVRTYNPGTAEHWKSRIAEEFQKHLPPIPYDEPICCNITFFLPRPKGLMRKKDPSEPIPCVSRRCGDRDNLDKAVLDTLTSIGFWRDDSLVCDGRIEKYYQAKDGPTGAIIAINSIKEVTT